MDMLKRGLDAAWLRNDVISQNIANVDTPNYKRKEVRFEEFLNAEMKTSRIDRAAKRSCQETACWSQKTTFRRVTVSTATMSISNVKWR
jgi:flagellar basal-body rod protein FlgB